MFYEVPSRRKVGTMTEMPERKKVLHVLLVEGENRDEWEKIRGFLTRQKGINLHSVQRISDAYKIVRAGDINVIISDYDRTGTKIFGYLKKFKDAKPYVENCPPVLKGYSFGSYQGDERRCIRFL